MITDPARRSSRHANKHPNQTRSKPPKVLIATARRAPLTIMTRTAVAPEYASYFFFLVVRPVGRLA
jgi:hypothetical protein